MSRWRRQSTSTEKNPPEMSRPIQDVKEDWCVIHTRANREKSLAHYCCQQNIDYFLPLNHATRAKPALLQGIIFVANTYHYVSNESDPRKAHEYKFHYTIQIIKGSGHAARVLHTLNQPRLRIDLIALSTPGIDIAELKHGDDVRVIAGDLKGLEGKADFKGKKLGIHLFLIDQWITLPVDINNLEKI